MIGIPMAKESLRVASQCRRFEGKLALVTGGGNGFGRATVHRLVDEGLEQVIIVDRDGAAAAAEVEKVRANGGNGFAIECDVADVDAVADMAREVASRIDRLHVLVNSAGISGSSQGRLEGDFLPTWDAVMNVNLRGTVLVAQGAAPTAEGGRGLHHQHLLGRRPLRPARCPGLRREQGGGGAGQQVDGL